MAERLYSFAELTRLGSELYNIPDGAGKKAAEDLVYRTERLLKALPKAERDAWARQAEIDFKKE